jgi:hypothetical protein
MELELIHYIEIGGVIIFAMVLRYIFKQHPGLRSLYRIISLVIAIILVIVLILIMEFNLIPN